MESIDSKARFQLTAADRRRLERTHVAKKPRLFEDNLPWHDAAFGRRFAQLTDVRHQYWGSPDADVDRIAALLSEMNVPDPHVVDLCCGAGRHALALAERKVRTTGLEISDYAVRRARGKAAARRLSARFVCADVSDPPTTDPADVACILCEQLVNFSPKGAQALIGTWLTRLTPGGAMVIEVPTELPPHADELYYQPEPLFFETGCWVRHTQDPDPTERTLMEVFTCLAEPGEIPTVFCNSRKYYTPADVAKMAPGRSIQVIDIPANDPRPDLQWIVIR